LGTIKSNLVTPPFRLICSLKCLKMIS